MPDEDKSPSLDAPQPDLAMGASWSCGHSERFLALRRIEIAAQIAALLIATIVMAVIIARRPGE
jgi:hypothetical protein